MRSDAQSNSFRRSTFGILGLLTLGLATGPFACSDDGDGDGGGSAGTSMAGSSGSGGGGGSAGTGMAGSAGNMAGSGGMGMAGGDMTGSVNPGAPGPNGLALPSDVFDWKVLGFVNRSDGGGIRVVVGNDTAIEAARSGNTANWPEGTMIADLAWADGTNDAIAGATVPGDFSLVALMVKDSDEYSESGGWGYGAWTGMGLAPVDEVALQGCVNCHTAEVADNDYVFTRVQLPPSPNTVAAANDAPNGVSLPDDFLDWRVLGVVDRSATDNNTVRVILGNDTAVDAARAGQVNPDWPDGSMIGHIVWAPADNDDAFHTDADGSVVAGTFSTITLMERDSQAFAEDGGWAYGAWQGFNLDAPEAQDFDADCIECHTNNVANNDYVFTIPGQLPNL